MILQNSKIIDIKASNLKKENYFMLKIFFKYFLLLNLTSIALVSEMQAMEIPGAKNNSQRKAINRHQGLEDLIQKEKKEEEKRERLEAKRLKREEAERKQNTDEEKRKRIMDAQAYIDRGEDVDLEEIINALDDAVANNENMERILINRYMTELCFLVDDKDSLENNARGVIVARAFAYYFAVTEGNLESTIKCLRYGKRHDPDSDKYYNMLIGIQAANNREIKAARNKRENEIKEAEQEKQKAIEAAIIQGRQNVIQEGKRETMMYGILIGAGGAFALVGALYGFSYLFADQSSYSADY